MRHLNLKYCSLVGVLLLCFSSQVMGQGVPQAGLRLWLKADDLALADNAPVPGLRPAVAMKHGYGA